MVKLLIVSAMLFCNISISFANCAPTIKITNIDLFTLTAQGNNKTLVLEKQEQIKASKNRHSIEICIYSLKYSFGPGSNYLYLLCDENGKDISDLKSSYSNTAKGEKIIRELALKYSNSNGGQYRPNFHKIIVYKDLL